MRFKPSVFVLLFAVAGTSGVANATLIGDTIAVDWVNQNNVLETTTATVVDPGPDLDFVFVFGRNNFQVDVGAFSILVTLLSDNVGFGSFSDLFVFRDLDFQGIPGAVIAGIDLVQTGVSGLTASFTDNSVTLNVTGSGVVTGRKRTD